MHEAASRSGPSSFRRRNATLVAAVLLAACSSAQRPRAQPLTSLAEINRALSWHFADVTLASGVVMRSVRGAEVTPERLRWTNEDGRRREMPIAEVVRIVQRARDPGATPPSEGARLLADGPDAAEAEHGGNMGSFSGDSALVAGAVYGALALAASQTDDPGVVLYEAPVGRYLASPAVPAETSTAVAADKTTPPPP